MQFIRKILDIPHHILTYIIVAFGMVPLFMFIMKALNRTEVRNKRNIQHADLPFIFVSNHVSMLDDAFIGPLVFSPRAFWDLRFIPYHTPERKNFFKGPFFSFIMWAARSIPFTRGTGVFQPGMEKVIRLLKGKNVVHIYPEGTRTRTGEIGKGRIGVGRIVRETGVKVIPCFHKGLDAVLPIGHKIPNTGKRIIIQIGETLYFDDFMQMPNTPKTWQMISDKIIEALIGLRDKVENENKDNGVVLNQSLTSVSEERSIDKATDQMKLKEGS